jgi:hypothetical protein
MRTPYFAGETGEFAAGKTGLPNKAHRTASAAPGGTDLIENMDAANHNTAPATPMTLKGSSEVWPYYYRMLLGIVGILEREQPKHNNGTCGAT